MKRPVCGIFMLAFLIAISVTSCALSQAQQANATSSPSETQSGWQEDFDISTCSIATTGRNDYFILEPGFQIVLEGGKEVLKITVLDETEEVDGVQTRVVEEREWRDGELMEVSRNFFAVCEETTDVYYFGEEVDMYAGGAITSHGGAWRSGEGDAKFGLIMPGDPRVGMKYYQEIAPGVALDRAEIVSLDEVLQTPAGEFSRSLQTVEGSGLNPLEREIKTYAPGIVLIQDANLLLTEHGFAEGQ